MANDELVLEILRLISNYLEWETTKGSQFEDAVEKIKEIRENVNKLEALQMDTWQVNDLGVFVILPNRHDIRGEEMKIIKIVCNICGKEDCDGKEYIVPPMHHIGVDILSYKVCSSQLRINKPGKRIYRSVGGHGIYWDYEFNEDGSFKRGLPT